jgi:rhodanese-related sulfurtransferase
MPTFSISRNTTLILLFIFAHFIPGCGQMTYDKKLEQLYRYTVPLIQPEGLQELKKENKDLVVLDTRNKEEYEVSHIKGALWVDYDNFDLTMIKDIPKHASVIVYCSVGYRSERIGEKLLEDGYDNVQNLYGGIFEWKNKGFTVVNNKLQPTDSVHTYNKKWSIWLNKGIKVY